MEHAMQIRDDELAEMEPQTLVAFYDAGADGTLVRPGEVFRPAGRYTGPGDAPAMMEGLLAGRAKGRLAQPASSAAGSKPRPGRTSTASARTACPASRPRAP